MRDDRAHFLAGHDDRRTALATCGSDVVEGELLDAEDALHEKRHGVKCLLLGGRGEVSLQCKEIEVKRDGRWSDFLRGLAEFEETEADEAAIPIDVGFLGGHGHVFETDGPAEGVDDGIEFGFGVTGARRSVDGLERDAPATLV